MKRKMKKKNGKIRNFLESVGKKEIIRYLVDPNNPKGMIKKSPLSVKFDDYLDLSCKWKPTWMSSSDFDNVLHIHRARKYNIFIAWDDNANEGLSLFEALWRVGLFRSKANDN